MVTFGKGRNIERNACVELLTNLKVMMLVYQTNCKAQIGLLQQEVTWYKTRQTGTQKNVPDSKIKAESCHILLLSSMHVGFRTI